MASDNIAELSTSLAIVVSEVEKLGKDEESSGICKSFSGLMRSSQLSMDAAVSELQVSPAHPLMQRLVSDVGIFRVKLICCWEILIKSVIHTEQFSCPRSRGCRFACFQAYVFFT